MHVLLHLINGELPPYLGLLTYEVTVVGQMRQAHTDHITPCPVPIQSTPIGSNSDDNPPDDQCATESSPDDIVSNPFLFIDNEELDRELEQENADPNQRPHAA